MFDFESVALYLTIALVAVVGIVGIIVYFAKREKFGDYLKLALGIALGYAISIIVMMLYIKFKEISLDDGIDKESYGLLLYPLIAELSIALAGGIAVFVASLFNKLAKRIAMIVTGLGLTGGFVAIMVQMSKYFAIVKDWYPNSNTVGLIVSGIISIMLIGVAYLLGDKRNISDTRSIVYGAVCIALSFALSYIRLFKLPQGGSITFASLFPLMIYCCMFGTRRGIIACLIYGTLQAVQDPWIIHPMQFLLDYTLAFGMIGVSGIFMEKGVFKNKKVLAFVTGGVLAVVLRYACHVCSGVFAFADFADLEKYSTAAAYSFAYNSFTLLDMAITLVVGSLLFASKSFTNQMQKSSNINKSDVVDDVVIEDEDDEIDKMIIASQTVVEEKVKDVARDDVVNSEE